MTNKTDRIAFLEKKKISHISYDEVARNNKITNWHLHKITSSPDDRTKHLPTKHSCKRLLPYKEILTEIVTELRAKKQYVYIKSIYQRFREKVPEYPWKYAAFRKQYLNVKSILPESPANCYIPLLHEQYEAQLDFGIFHYITDGKELTSYFLLLSFPYSNASYCQLLRAKNIQSVLFSLQTIFEYTHCSPKEMWCDNDTCLMYFDKENQKHKLQLFEQFTSYYNINVLFCNSKRGNEKGNIERNIKYFRENLLVPIPIIDDMDKYNIELLKRCDKINTRIHYSRREAIIDLFEESKLSMNAPQTFQFDASTLKRVMLNPLFSFSLIHHKYFLPISIIEQNKMQSVKFITISYNHKEIKCYFNDVVICVLPRHYYMEKTVIADKEKYLRYITLNPKCLYIPEVFSSFFPNEIQHHLLFLNPISTSRFLKTFTELVSKSNFEIASLSVCNSLKKQKIDKHSFIIEMNHLIKSLKV